MKKTLSVSFIFLFLLGGCATMKSLWGDPEKESAEAPKPAATSVKSQTASRAPVSVSHPQPATPVNNESSKQPPKAQIRLVQQRLKAQGYDPGPIDGALGVRTRAALQKYQGANGLPGNGTLDPKTLKALGVEY